MSVVLFDQGLDGHHAEYATWVATYLRESGDDVTFATLRPPHRDIDLAELGNVASIRYMEAGSSSATRRGHASRLWALTRGSCFATSIAIEEQADVLHYLYLDRAEIPVWSNMVGRRHP